MHHILAVDYKSKRVGYIVTDILIVAFIYLIPTLSHLTSIPFYLFDPMRLALVFCIINTNRKNSLFIALTLPFISLLISAHPVVIKSILITAELVINALAFYYFTKRMKNVFISMFLSILFAKVFYYFSKIVFLSLGLIQGDLISTPLWIQYVMILIFSLYAVLAMKKSSGDQFR